MAVGGANGGGRGKWQWVNEGGRDYCKQFALICVYVHMYIIH